MSLGFSQETFDFLTGLEANNSKDWFDAHKSDYEAHLKAPALALIDNLSAEMARLDPVLKCEPRINGSLKRINRDVRFSKDKAPYNPRIHMVFWAGTHPNRSAAMHVVIGPRSLGYGAGQFGFEPAALGRIRNGIMQADSRTELVKAIDSAKRVGCSMGEPDLKNLPRGYALAEDWEYLLRYKTFVTRTREDKPVPKWATNSSIVPEILSLTRACLPFVKWLHVHG